MNFGTRLTDRKFANIQNISTMDIDIHHFHPKFITGIWYGLKDSKDKSCNVYYLDNIARVRLINVCEYR